MSKRKLNFVSPSFVPRTNIGKSPLTKLSDRPDPILKYNAKGSTNKATTMDASKSMKDTPKLRTKNESRKGSKEYTPPIFIDIDSIFSSEDFNTEKSDEGRTGLFPERRSAPLTFDYRSSNPLTVMQLEDNQNGLLFSSAQITTRYTSKLSINLGGYFTNFKVAGTPWRRHLEIIYQRYSRDIVSNIKSKIIDDWTETNFCNYMYDVVRLMSFYYSVDSILSYEASLDKKDRNPVLVQMKTEFSDFALLSKHKEAERILKNCWLPHQFSSLIAWTYQNYKTGEGDQCANYRIFSEDYFLKNPGNVNFDALSLTSFYNLIINNVTSVVNRNLISLLSQTYPLGVIKTLPLSCSEAVHDPKHYEFFINQGITWLATAQPNGAFKGFPNCADYNLYSSQFNAEEAGCFPFVLTSSFDSGIGAFNNGCFIPTMRRFGQDGGYLPATHWDHCTNKFYAYNNTPGSDNYTILSRNIKYYSDLSPIQDTHVMSVDESAQDAMVGVKGCNSMSKGHFQNLYFNTSESRILVMREFLNSLFYLK